MLTLLTLKMRVAVGKKIDAVISDDDAGLAAGVAFPHDDGQTTPLLPRASTIVTRAASALTATREVREYRRRDLGNDGERSR